MIRFTRRGLSGLGLPFRHAATARSVVDFFFYFGTGDRFITSQMRIDRAFSPFTCYTSFFISFLSAHALSTIFFFFILYFARRFLSRASALGDISRDVASRDKIASSIARVEKLQVDFRMGTIRINCVSEKIL